MRGDKRWRKKEGWEASGRGREEGGGIKRKDENKKLGQREKADLKDSLESTEMNAKH